MTGRHGRSRRPWPGHHLAMWFLRALVAVHLAVIAGSGPAAVLSAAAVLAVGAPVIRAAARRRDAAHRVLLSAGVELGAAVVPPLRALRTAAESGGEARTPAR